MTSAAVLHVTVPAMAEWVQRLCDTPFFGACRLHHDVPKNDCTMFCIDAPKAPALCGHCAPLVDPALRLLQVRRYVYRDVVKSDDISRYLDVSGVQAYTVNGCSVMFLKPNGAAGSLCGTGACRRCMKRLREGAEYCSVVCKASRKRSHRIRPRKQASPTRAVE